MLPDTGARQAASESGRLRPLKNLSRCVSFCLTQVWVLCCRKTAGGRDGTGHFDMLSAGHFGSVPCVSMIARMFGIVEGCWWLRCKGLRFCGRPVGQTSASGGLAPSPLRRVLAPTGRGRGESPIGQPSPTGSYALPIGNAHHQSPGFEGAKPLVRGLGGTPRNTFEGGWAENLSSNCDVVPGLAPTPVGNEGPDLSGPLRDTARSCDGSAGCLEWGAG